MPTTAFVAGSTPPFCIFGPSGTLCTSALSLQWNVGFDAFLTVGLGSADRPSPGAAPGFDVNGIVIILTVDATQPNPTRVEFYCNFALQNRSCDFTALGITADGASRTLRFVNTAVPLVAGGTITLNGSLNW